MWFRRFPAGDLPKHYHDGGGDDNDCGDDDYDDNDDENDDDDDDDNDGDNDDDAGLNLPAEGNVVVAETVEYKAQTYHNNCPGLL